MNSALKVLVAIACVVVIAAAGLYFYRDSQASQSRQAAEQERVTRSACRQAAERPDVLTALHQSCLAQGY
jgi:hypothetical protein